MIRETPPIRKRDKMCEHGCIGWLWKVEPYHVPHFLPSRNLPTKTVQITTPHPPLSLDDVKVKRWPGDIDSSPYVAERPQWMGDGNNVGDARGTGRRVGYRRGESSVLLVVETSAELGWEAENGGSVWQGDWESQQALE